MVPGFNHNIPHKGKTYHIQTEDSGISSPHIITLLYIGGTILAREKTSYADIIKVDNLEEVVRDLMQEQHKKMLRKLLTGGFTTGTEEAPAKSAAEPEAPTKSAAEPEAPAEKELEIEINNKDFGGDVISSKGLDEVMLDFLSDIMDEEGKK